MSDKIDVAYALDNNYTMFTCVSMTSLLHNTQRNIHFHVLESRLSDANKQILSDIGKRYTHGEWTFYHVDCDASFIVQSNMHLGAETYFRLFLPELLCNIRKILWIDSDTVVGSDISELFDTDISDYYAAVVPDNALANDGSRKRILNMLGKDLYFNAGVMLLNLEKIGKIDLLAESRKITETLYSKYIKKKIPFYSDQEVLNFLFARRVMYLSWKYNFMFYLGNSPEGGVISDVFTLTEVIEAIKKPVVMHLQGAHLRDIAKLPAKPIYEINWKEWYKYKALTSFADKDDVSRIKKYEERLQLLESTVLDQKSYFQIKRYSTFIDTTVVIEPLLKGRSVVIWGLNIYTRLLIALLEASDIKVIGVVDGLIDNQLLSVYDILTEHPDMLNGASDKYFVLLDMNDRKVANHIAVELNKYGYGKNDFYYVYEPLYTAIEGEAH